MGIAHNNNIELHFNKIILKMMEHSLTDKDMDKINELTSSFDDDEMEILSELIEFYFKAGLKEGINFKKYLI